MDLKRIGVTSPEMLYAIVQDYLTRQQIAPQLRYNYPHRRPVEEVSPHRVKVKNDTEETIPPYACMRITGVEIVGGQTCIKVEKPSSTEGEFLFNSQYAIEAEAVATESEPAKTGVGWGYRYGIVVALGNGTPPTAANVRYRPVVDSWTIEQGDGFFTVFGEHEDATDAVIGRFNSSGDLVPGIVTAQRTCNPGYYTVQLADWSGTYSNETDSAECPTYTVTGEGTTACAISITEPALQVTGRVDDADQPITVLAYDCQSTVVPLKLSKMVLLKNLGHTVVVGTGEAAVTTPVWQIVRGRQVDAVFYEDTYSCCDGEGESGTETLISRIPSILVGFRLPQIDCGDCTP